MSPTRLTKIDELTRGDHWYLEETDQCYFLGEYTARGGFQASETNQHILNLKKSVERKGRPEYRYKLQAVSRAGMSLRQCLSKAPLDQFTLVPIPPSKARSDPLYDDRMLQVLRVLDAGRSLDIRELVLQKDSLETPVHETDNRPRPDELALNYFMNPEAMEPVPRHVILFDDLITTGAHFRAMESVIMEQFPEVSVIGIFLARRVPETIDVEDWFDDEHEN